MYQIITNSIDDDGIEQIATWTTDNELEAQRHRKNGDLVLTVLPSMDHLF